MTNDLQARLTTAERMNRWLIAGTPEAILAERAELQAELRHRALLAALGKITTAVEHLDVRLWAARQNTGRIV